MTGKSVTRNSAVPATPKAIIMVAMDEEAAPFLTAAESTASAESVGGATRQLLTVNGHHILVVRSGIGVANAAAAAAIVLSEFAQHGGPKPVLISAGSAGGLGIDVRVGDVVVGQECVYSQADARAFGYALGQVPGMPARYAADARWHGLALASAAALDGVGTQLRAPAILRTGLMLTSDSFVGPDLVDDVRSAWPDGLSVDMESTALAQIAYQFGVPFVSVRGISDLCGPAGEFASHVDDAADRSAAVVLAMLAAHSRD